MEPEIRENYRVVITAWVIVLLGLGEWCQLNTPCTVDYFVPGCLIVGIVLEIINRHHEAIRGLAFFIVALILLVPGSKYIC